MTLRPAVLTSAGLVLVLACCTAEESATPPSAPSAPSAPGGEAPAAAEAESAALPEVRYYVINEA